MQNAMFSVHTTLACTTQVHDLASQPTEDTHGRLQLLQLSITLKVLLPTNPEMYVSKHKEEIRHLRVKKEQW